MYSWRTVTHGNLKNTGTNFVLSLNEIFVWVEHVKEEQNHSHYKQAEDDLKSFFSVPLFDGDSRDRKLGT